jgi:hypothetical protein
MGGCVVDGVDGGAHLRVGEGEEPAGAVAEAFFHVQAQRLNEHGGGDLLGDEIGAGTLLAELLAHAFQGGAELGFIGLGAEMDDGRKLGEEQPRQLPPPLMVVMLPRTAFL